VQQTYGPWFSSGNWWGAEIWSVEKWDLIARTGNETLCCCLARNPMRPASSQDWRIEALYD
jgi:protein ImuB